MIKNYDKNFYHESLWFKKAPWRKGEKNSSQENTLYCSSEKEQNLFLLLNEEGFPCVAMGMGSGNWFAIFAVIVSTFLLTYETHHAPLG